jgi:hypothetical protein
MRIRQLITACAATALLAAPATALAATGPTPGPKASAKAKAKAYGKRCKHQSRRHLAGRSGTNFSRCTTAMAKIANGKAGPKRACRTLPGTTARKRSPYGRCVVSGKKLQRQLHGDEQYTDPLG